MRKKVILHTPTITLLTTSSPPYQAYTTNYKTQTTNNLHCNQENILLFNNKTHSSKKEKIYHISDKRFT